MQLHARGVQCTRRCSPPWLRKAVPSNCPGIDTRTLVRWDNRKSCIAFHGRGEEREIKLLRRVTRSSSINTYRVLGIDVCTMVDELADEVDFPSARREDERRATILRKIIRQRY